MDRETLKTALAAIDVLIDGAEAELKNERRAIMSAQQRGAYTTTMTDELKRIRAKRDAYKQAWEAVRAVV